MTQTRLFFRAPQATAERAYALLERAFEDDGLPLAIVEADEENRIFEVSLYVEGEVDAVAARAQDELSSLGSMPEIEREIVPDIDWVTHSLQGLTAVRSGRFLVHGSHERERRRIGDIAIEIEAGLAFGTGHHGTTAGCLEMIARVMKEKCPRNALDLGTGSAVLAIAIARLANIPVLATDIDPVAVRVARENVRLNRVAGRVTTRTAAGFHDPVFARFGPFDLIVANILARPLMSLAPAMASHAAPGASVVLSGILHRQRNAVLAAYVGQGFHHVTTLHREGWVTIHLKR